MDLLLLNIFPDFSLAQTWISLLTLTFLEIVLGVDNIIFISIISGKLKGKEQKRATNIGLILAMAMRIALLFGVSVLVAMEKPWIEFHGSWFRGGLSGQSIILILGGIFLLYKATTEIHHKLEGSEKDVHQAEKKATSVMNAVIQISIINIVFSIDSILTAVGMTTGIEGALGLMIVAVVISVLIMMLFANPVGNFVNDHPTIQMLGLSFLILIGFMLIVEGAHIGHIQFGETEIGTVPKGYLYFAIAFSLLVEFLNMRLRKRLKPVQLHGVQKAAKGEGFFHHEAEAVDQNKHSK